MPSKAERIADRLVTLLLGQTGAGVNVWRDRTDAMVREESPSILIELSKEDTQSLGARHPSGLGGLDVNELEVSVVVCVRDAQWQTVADAVRVQAHALIATDPVLRGLVSSLKRAATEWRPRSADVPFGYAAQIYAVKYTSRSESLDAD